MDSETPAAVATESDVGVQSPRLPQRGFLKSTWILFDKAVSPNGIVILPDSTREMIGIYGTNTCFPITIRPTLGEGVCLIEMFAQTPHFEMRYSTHGPTVRDGWAVDSNASSVTVLLVSREGG